MTEGFWYSKTQPWFPLPQPYVGLWHDRELFLERLKLAESRCPTVGYRGFSVCRICGKPNGNQEFKTDDWTWPQGYRHYIEEHGVRPTPMFEKVILGELYADPERYREWYRINVLSPKLARIREEGKDQPLTQDELKYVKNFKTRR